MTMWEGDRECRANLESKALAEINRVTATTASTVANKYKLNSHSTRWMMDELRHSFSSAQSIICLSSFQQKQNTFAHKGRCYHVNSVEHFQDRRLINVISKKELIMRMKILSCLVVHFGDATIVKFSSIRFSSWFLKLCVRLRWSLSRGRLVRSSDHVDKTVLVRMYRSEQFKIIVTSVLRNPLLQTTLRSKLIL